MLEFLASRAYVFWILVLIFVYLYQMGGEDIIFFRKKRYEIDPKAGEKLADALNKFTRSRDFSVMGPTTIEYEGKEYSFDSLLFTYSGLTVLSLQPQIGEIYTNLSEEEWVKMWDGKRSTFPNPLLDMAGNEKLFREIFRNEGIKYGTTQNLVVFTNNHANVVASRNVPACHVKNLDAKLSDKVLADNSANIEGMKAAIEKYKK